MSSIYTSYQKSAIATYLFAALWALISLGIAIMLGLQSASALTVFVIMTLVALILIPLYLKKIKPAFIVGIIVLVLSLHRFRLKDLAHETYSKISTMCSAP